jgi:tetratricopeptide (TPR) repeat protein
VRKSRQHIYFLAAAVALITVLVYLSCLKNEFINWDDGNYVFDNVHIRSLDAAFFKWAFFDFYAANWHPLTWISHAVDYALWGLNPLGHHLTNIILHAINTFLVVFLVIRLLEAWNERTVRNGPPSFLNERAMFVAAGTTGLLFGLHPVHVESVAWVAERKDLLCGLFFLLSLILYTKYANDEGMNAGAPRFFNKRYLGALGLFVLALMSKPMAVSLPVVLLILDWYPFGRVRSLNTAAFAIAEKLPFIALSALSSVVTIMAQRAGGALRLNEVIPLQTRVLVAAQALVVYLRKMIWPSDLVPFYSYPRTASPASFEYLFPLLLIAGITAACIALSGKRKVWLSTWAFYTATLIPVLGIVQVGNQSMADRYTYLPSLGPFLIAGLGAAWISERVNALKKGAQLMKGFTAIVAVSILVFLSSLTFKQINIWTNSIQLWDYSIEKTRQSEFFYYYNRGQAFDTMGRFDRALEDYDKVIALNPTVAVAYYNRAIIFDKLGQPDRAFADYNRVLTLDPSYYGAYINRGLLFYSRGQFDNAIADFDTAISLKPDDPEAYYNQGLVFDRMGQLDKALADYDRALSFNPKDADSWNNRGLIYSKMGRFDRAIEDFGRAISLSPAYSDAYYNRGLAFQKSGQPDKANEDFMAWKAYSAKQ